MHCFKTTGIRDTLTNVLKITPARLDTEWKERVFPFPKQRRIKTKREKITIHGYEFLLHALLMEKDVFKHYSPKITNEKRAYHALMGTFCGQHQYDAIKHDVYILLRAHRAFNNIYKTGNVTVKSVIELRNLHTAVERAQPVMDRIGTTYRLTDTKYPIRITSFQEKRTYDAWLLLEIVKNDLEKLYDLVKTIHNED